MDIKLKNVRLSFNDLFVAKEFKPGDNKPRFSASFIIEPGSENDKTIRDAIKAEAKETFGDKATRLLAGLEGQKNQYCYMDGNKRGYAGETDMMVLSCHRAAKLGRPTIVDADRSPLSQDDGKPYSGCYVYANVSIYCQTGENPGVRASFAGIQFYRNGEPLSGGKASTIDDFEELETPEEDFV